MVNVYRDFLSGVGGSFDVENFNRVPGGKIMAATNGRKDMDSLFGAFCLYFRITNPWLWVGGPVTPNAGEILDGEKNTGQCFALARAFRTLAVSAEPYGIGLLPDDVGSPNDEVVGGTFKGLNGDGFVSEHRDDVSPAGTVLGLRSNIFCPPAAADPLVLVTGTTERTTLYLWANHKTVPYNGQYYDALYGKKWVEKKEMAVYNLDSGASIMRRQFTADGTEYQTEFLPAKNSRKDVFYFRQLLELEITAVGANGYQGPYSVLPGTP